jgi:hypothetical protein
MTNEEVLEIIKKENFKLYNWYRSHELRPNEICIEKKGKLMDCLCYR